MAKKKGDDYEGLREFISKEMALAKEQTENLAPLRVEDKDRIKDRIVNEYNCGLEMLDLFEKFFQSPRIIQNLYDMVDAMSDVYSQYYRERAKLDRRKS